MKSHAQNETGMAARRHAIPGRVCALALLVVLSLAVAVAAGGCGSKAKSPSGGPPTLYPSTSPSTSSGGPSPSPSSRPSSTATPTSSASATSKPISDDAIRTGILRRLSQEPTLVGIQFTVHVLRAVVRMYGTVDTQAQRTMAQNIAVGEPGIKKVISFIQVNGQPGD